MNGNKGSPVLLTGRDITLLRSLAEVKLLDREQIRRLLDFGSVTRVNDRLSRLHGAGLLHRYFLGTLAGGRKALYSLSQRGASSIGRERTWKLQRAEDSLLVGEAFVEHQLAVNWCWISLKCGAGSGLIRFLRFNEPISASLPLAPDGYAELNVSGAVQPIFLEVDLGTETSRVWDRKVDLYLRLAASGEFERIFQQQRFRVAVVCSSERRMESLRRIVQRHTTKLFYFSLFQTIKSDGFHAPHWLRPEGETRQYRHEHKELKPATVNRDLSVLRRILYWGVDEGYLAANPLGRLRMERERRTKRPILSVWEEKLLLAYAPEHLQQIILCALCTGMRRGEILGQQWEDVDLGNRLLNVSRSKTPEGEMREIPLASPLYALLKGIRKDRGPVFTFKGDSISFIKTAWVASVRRSKLRHFRFHDLRHCFNTRLMMAGVMQEVRREILGHTSHKSKDVNDRYTHVELPQKCEAIAKLELWLAAQEKLPETDEHNDNYAPAAGPEPKPKEDA